jgi:hypothetical protein
MDAPEDGSMKRTKVVFEHDSDPDFSWLEQDHYNPRHSSYTPVYRTKEDMDAERNPIDGDYYRDPQNHVALCMLVYEMDEDNEDWVLVDSLGSIDFMADEDNWTTGTFYRLDAIPERCDYQRELAKEHF